MRRTILILSALLVCTHWALAGDIGAAKLKYWHQWRGPQANGVAPEAEPPVRWDDNTNIRWRFEIPGKGSSSPIVWGDKVFLLTAINTGKVDPKLPKPEDQPKRLFNIRFPNTVYRFVVQCINRRSGKVRWQKVANELVPHEGHHPDNDFASASPITDGQSLYVSFGSNGIFCYDLDGNLKWKRFLGRMHPRRNFGEGASPALHGDTLIVNWDHDAPSYIFALDAKTGETRWQDDRDETTTWATPLIVEHDGKVQVITNASNRVRSYDISSGKVLWACGGQVGNVTPSPVTRDGIVYCMSGYQGSAGYAIPLDARGDVTGSGSIVWKLNRGTPYVPSPLLYDDLLYFNQRNDAVVSCIRASTGETVVPRRRLAGLRRIYASPVGAAGKVYFTGRDGTTVVCRHNADLEVIATNKLNDPIDASAAIVGNELFLRGKRYLYCIAAD